MSLTPSEQKLVKRAAEAILRYRAIDGGHYHGVTADNILDPVYRKDPCRWTRLCAAALDRANKEDLRK